MSRNLGVLVIEDKPEFIESFDDSFIDLFICSGITDTNERDKAKNVHNLVGQIARAKKTIDIIIFDVNMYADIIQDFDYSEDQLFNPYELFDLRAPQSYEELESLKTTDPIIPYGPLLTLPFLAYASPHLQILPISAYWEQDEIVNNGLFLVALSLLLSKGSASQDGHVHPLTLRKNLANKSGKELGLGVNSLADPLAYSDAIEGMIRNVSELIFTTYYSDNLGDVIKNLKFLMTQLESGLSRASFHDEVQKIAIYFSDKYRNPVDEISISSLFQDILKRRKKKQALQQIILELEDYFDSGDHVNVYEYAEIAKKLVIGIPDEPGWSETQIYDATLSWDGVGKEFIRYYASLFIWVKAWFLKCEYYRDSKSVNAYFADLLGNKHNRQLQYLMYCSKARFHMRRNLKNPSALRKFWESKDLEDYDVAQYKLDKIDQEGLILPLTDIELASQYYKELLREHSSDLSIERARGLLPSWIKI